MTDTQTACVLNDADRIEAYRMASLVGALKLESKGLSMLRGGKRLRPLWASTLGLSPRASYDAFIDAATKRKEECLRAFQEKQLAAQGE